MKKTQYQIKRSFRLVVLVAITSLASISPALADVNYQNTSLTIINANDAQFDEQYLLQRALLIQQHLANKKYQNITSYIHPTKGVRFSMYAYVNPKTDKVFSREQFAKYLSKDNIKFTWGEQDGRGDLYVAPLPFYLNNWVRANNYTDNPSTVTINTFQGRGNSLNNLKDIYPNKKFIEFYHSGTNPIFEGMDWRSLRLVFDKYQGDYYLIAIITDEWTI